MNSNAKIFIYLSVVTTGVTVTSILSNFLANKKGMDKLITFCKNNTELCNQFMLNNTLYDPFYYGNGTEAYEKHINQVAVITYTILPIIIGSVLTLCCLLPCFIKALPTLDEKRKNLFKTLKARTPHILSFFVVSLLCTNAVSLFNASYTESYICTSEGLFSTQNCGREFNFTNATKIAQLKKAAVDVRRTIANTGFLYSLLICGSVSLVAAAILMIPLIISKREQLTTDEEEMTTLFESDEPSSSSSSGSFIP